MNLKVISVFEDWKKLLSDDLFIFLNERKCI